MSWSTVASGHPVDAITVRNSAQQVGAVRADIDVRDLHAVMAGALAIEQRAGVPGRGMSVVIDGLRPR
jgi:hypothetical protein